MNIEKFDHVHDVQRMYRAVLDSMSKPGRVNNIAKELDKIDTYSDIPKEIMGMAYLLLNTESSFYIEEKDMQNYIKLHTYASPVSINNADYIFIDKERIEEKDLCNIIEESKKGDLLDPHKGATLLIKTRKLSKGNRYRITGPGIKGYHETPLGNLGRDFIDSRKRANKEYPMGVDIIILDESGKVAALPRTTKIEVID